jgi:hypothetical protein
VASRNGLMNFGKGGSQLVRGNRAAVSDSVQVSIGTL